MARILGITDIDRDWLIWSRWLTASRHTWSESHQTSTEMRTGPESDLYWTGSYGNDAHWRPQTLEDNNAAADSEW